MLQSSYPSPNAIVKKVYLKLEIERIDLKMQNSNRYTTQTEEKKGRKPKLTISIVYIVLALALCVFSASVWFSSYAKRVVLRQGPVFQNQRNQIQHEIHKLELVEETLTEVRRVRQITKELDMVEPTGETQWLQDK